MSAFAADPAVADHVVINQAYGGGGNSGALYTNDFIELYNPTNADVSLEGWSVQYATKTGTFNNITNLSGTIKAGSFYLIQMAAGTTVTDKPLPTPDATGTAAMAKGDFKVALVNGTTAVSGPNDATVVDFLGAGAANAFEGTAAPAAANDKAVVRAVLGVDTDDNGADFIKSAPEPRNSATSTGGTTPDPDPTPGDTKTAKLVTNLSDITAGGDFVIVAQEGDTYKALGTSIDDKISPVDVTVENDVVTGD